MDNFSYLETQDLTRHRQTTQLIIARPASGDHQGTADLQQRSAQLSNNRQGTKSPCRGDIEALPTGSASIILKARVDDLHIPDSEPCGGGRHPVQPPSVRVYERK